VTGPAPRPPDAPAPPLLEVRDLAVEVTSQEVPLPAVRGVSFELREGETFCIVGESGCGKSLTGLALMGLMPRGASLRAERLNLAGEDLLHASPSRLRDLRGNAIGMIFQDPMTSLNPVYTIGEQLIETYLRHRRATRSEARERATELLHKVGVTAIDERLRQYPHQLSGGLRQRIMIAMALMCGPKLIVADEPTTALDVTIQIQVLVLLRQLQREFNTGLLLITHDLGVVARVADRVAVMYAGQIVETGSVEAVFRAPQHPYTRGLLASIPVPGLAASGRLRAIRGSVPSLRDLDAGCSFRNRCDFAAPGCALPVTSTIGPEGHEVRCIRSDQLEAVA
jgi:peptide/nickel transport system ATP-binding protein